MSDQTPEPPADPPASDDVTELRRQSASYRRKLREVEGQRDALLARVDASDRREVERIAADRMANPADLLLVASLDDMRADDGALDPDKVTASVDKVLADRGHWRKAEPEPTGHPNLHNGPRSPAPEPVTFGDLLKKTR